jgi:uncharacterized protein (TIGR00299 family) protein
MIAYFDLFSGISGDMTLGALVDLGVPIDALQGQLAELKIPGYHLEFQDVMSGGIRAKRACIQVSGSKPRSYRQIRELIESADLLEGVKDRATRIFQRIAKAESKIHGVSLDEVWFHEIGATDSIIDIVGTAVGLNYIGIDEIYFPSVPLTHGEVVTEHGVLPLPALATVELLIGSPTHFVHLGVELVTPTGAAILTALGTHCKNQPDMILHRVGCGAGQRELPDRPNLLRIFLGSRVVTAEGEEQIVLETNIDDMSPEIYEHLMERLFEAGSLDVWLTPILMKKSRPGTLVHVLCQQQDQDNIAKLVFKETTTLGVRLFPVRRMTLPRRLEKVQTPLGTISVKVGGAGESIAPEYEECKKIARDQGVPLKRVYELAIMCYRKRGE